MKTEEPMFDQKSILLIGNGKLAYSVYVCILTAGHKVQFYTEDNTEATKQVNLHLENINHIDTVEINCYDLNNLPIHHDIPNYDVAIVITPEKLELKKSILQIAEQTVSSDAIIAVNTESIALSALQKDAKCPQRILGVNWSEPAHTTFFLEIITNNTNLQKLVTEFYNFAKQTLQKDPYILKNDKGVRTRMLCAMIREAFYLVENGYVSVEDIDRACRNDAGYYLPFAGNFRYMDLMGTFLYGIVMKELNPELSKESAISPFFENIIKEGGEGMKNGRGFYQYENGDSKKWDEIFMAFSYQIQKIIQKYNFNETENQMQVADLIVSDHE